MPSPLPPSLWSDGARRLAAAIALLAVAAIGFGAGYLVFDDSGDGEAPAPTSVVLGPGEQPTAAPAGFPEAATRNTTRVGGADAIADAASVALATYPTQGGVGATAAVTLAPADSWQQALAATPLVADPIGTPVLLSSPGEVPQPTTDALTALSPTGLEEAGGTEAFVVGGVAAPDGLKTSPIEGTDPADVADAVDAERAKITGEKDPAHLLVVSSADPGLAMPAAAWAARSGDPILFADGNDVPAGTMTVIKRHPDTPVFVLGPESAISDKALKELGSATRVGAEDPVDNAIEFARFSSGDFGWDINDPGHGFAIANVDRPLDAAAAAPLAGHRRQPRAAAAHRRGRQRAPGAAELPQRHPARVRGRPDPSRLQPRLDHRRQRRHLDSLPGPGRPADEARAGQRQDLAPGRLVARRHRRRRNDDDAARARHRRPRRPRRLDHDDDHARLHVDRQRLRQEPLAGLPGRLRAMSEAERSELRDPAHRPTADDIRALAGPSTPHFALQIRNRIAALIERLPDDDPAHIEGRRQIARLNDLAHHTGDPRGPGPGVPDPLAGP